MNASLSRRDHFALELYKLFIELHLDRQIPLCDFADHSIKAADMLIERLDCYPEGIFNSEPPMNSFSNDQTTESPSDDQGAE